VTSPVIAISEFSTDYQIKHDVHENGLTSVTYLVSQTNNLSTVYATQFSLSVGQVEPSSVVVIDESQLVYPNISSTQNSTNISFPFANRVVGKDKVHHFSITYLTKDVVRHIGSIWEINIPNLAGNSSTRNVEISLKVPTTFPELAYISPKPTSSEQYSYKFNNLSLANRPITAIFGKTQYFDLSLYYNLENTLPKEKLTKIALPPDTNYQTINIYSIDPKPAMVESDPDGNWLASYQLPSQGSLQVKVKAFARIDLYPKRSSLSETITYTQSAGNFWPTNDPKIVQLSQQLSGPESIYQYIVENLGYDLTRLREKQVRPGALFALENPKRSICTEFSDLFITLSRSKKIPARELQGFAFSNNDQIRPVSLSQDVLHSWPEYYDSSRQTWIQIDPTWANTTKGIDYFNKLDMSHIVFAIHGTDPENPSPAGSYKTSNSNSKDVYVEPHTPITFPNPVLKFFASPKNRSNLELSVQNDSGVSFSGPLVISSQSIHLSKQTTLNLAPFSSATIPIALSTKARLTKINLELQLNANNQQYAIPIELKSDLETIAIPTAVSAILVILTLVSGYLYLRKRRQNASLHW